MSLKCLSCHHQKASLQCGLCEGALCKKCVQTLAKDSFSLWETIPELLRHHHYCIPCFQKSVATPLADYENTLRLAEGVFVFEKSKSEETRLFNRSQKPLRVEDCADERDTLMRLAFQAAKLGCNTLIDVEIRSKKVRNAGYQTTRWSGSGIPSVVATDWLKKTENR